MIKGKLEHEYDTEEGELFELEIEYSYVPYTPAKLTADPYSEPEDGGCEEIIFKVVGYRQYDDDDKGTVTLDWPKLTPEQSKELTDKFDKMVAANQRVYDYFQEMCDADAEAAMEPDYDD